MSNKPFTEGIWGLIYKNVFTLSWSVPCRSVCCKSIELIYANTEAGKHHYGRHDGAIIHLYPST
jgi:hypothetical protein